MKVGLDISPLSSGHKVRGIGKYTEYLVKEFKKGKYDNIQFEYFENSSSLPLVDIIHFPYFDLYFHTLPFRKRAGSIVTIHDVIPLMFSKHFPVGIKGKINFMAQKLSLSNVNAIICDSNSSKRDIISKLGVKEGKVHVVYLAPSNKFQIIKNKDRLKKISVKYKLPPKFILYVGDVNWSKNIPNLLKTVKEADVNIVMVGKSLADRTIIETQEIEKLIKKLGIKEKTTKLGFIDENDLIAIYNLADLTVVPSYYEGFGLPLLESMACGTPVACSNVSSLKEIGKDVATFFDPTDINDIATKINRFMRSNTYNKSKIAPDLIKHSEKYSWAKTAAQTIKVYQSVFNL